jgi:Cu2+-exporting ATPase
VLGSIVPLAGMSPERCLQLAHALEAASAHPLALAIRRAHDGQALQAFDLHCELGQGVEGYVNGVPYRLGTAGYAAGLCGQAPAFEACAGASPVYLASDAGLLARFELTDAVRADAAALVRQMQASGKQVILLSGDHQAIAARVAASLGIGEAIGGQLPEQKLAYVQMLQSGGAVVAMVGDGVNDAAVLRAADVSFAMGGGGAALAQLSADCVLLAGRLGALGEAASTAARTLSIIRQNLAWASVYNLLAIPAAAFGLLNPWLSAAGMSLSSALVVLNALRLRRGKD